MKLWLYEALLLGVTMSVTKAERECTANIGKDFSEDNTKFLITPSKSYTQFDDCRTSCRDDSKCLSYQMTDLSTQKDGILNKKYSCLKYKVDITAKGLTDGSDKRVYGQCPSATRECTINNGKTNAKRLEHGFIKFIKGTPGAFYKSDGCRMTCRNNPDCLSYHMLNNSRTIGGTLRERYFCLMYQVDKTAGGLKDKEKTTIGTCPPVNRECSTNIGIKATENEITLLTKTYRTFDDCRTSCSRDYRYRSYEMTDSSWNSTEKLNTRDVNEALYRPYSCSTYMVDVTASGLTDEKETRVYGACKTKATCTVANRECTTNEAVRQRGEIEREWENLIKEKPLRYNTADECLISCIENLECRSYLMFHRTNPRVVNGTETKIKYDCLTFKSDITANGIESASTSFQTYFNGVCTCKTE